MLNHWTTREVLFLPSGYCQGYCSELGTTSILQVTAFSYFRLKPRSGIAGSLNPGVELVGFPGGSEVKASAWNVGDLGSIPGLGRSPGEGNGNPL